MAESNFIIDGSEFTYPSIMTAEYVGQKPYGSSQGDLKVYIPELMQGIPKGEAKSLGGYAINKTIFCNSKECAITPMIKVLLQNYVTAKATSLNYKLPDMDFGAKITVKGNDHDMQSITITMDIDSSTSH